MIKDNQRAFNQIHILLDAILIAGCYLLSYVLRFDLLTAFEFFAIEPAIGFYSIEHYASYLIYLVPGYLVLYSTMGLYRPKRGRMIFNDFSKAVQANVLGLLYFNFILNFIERDANISRKFMILFILLNTAVCFLFRYVLDRILRALRRRGKNIKHVLIVGYSHAAEGYIDRIRANPQWGYYVYGSLDDYMENGTMYKKIPVVGTIHELEAFLGEHHFDEIAIAISMNHYDMLPAIVGLCEKSGIHTKFIPDYRNIVPTNPVIEDLAGLPAINIRNVPLTNLWNRIVKRSVDLIGSMLAIVIFSPVMLVTAILIKLSSPGPVLFKQTRVGLNNKEFTMYKFRSMVVQPESKEKKAWTTAGDVRVTKVGRFIRKTSIDELPQLFNVFIGNMSLVGPRPERPFFVAKFKEEIPRYMIKHQVRPGMTGWAQINGYRGDTSIRKRIEHDLYYIENWKLGLDIRILILTVFKGFISPNAY